MPAAVSVITSFCPTVSIPTLIEAFHFRIALRFFLIKIEVTRAVPAPSTLLASITQYCICMTLRVIHTSVSLCRAVPELWLAAVHVTYWKYFVPVERICFCTQSCNVGKVETGRICFRRISV
jgi:hypothetical protein